jgi:hypothetical protein
MKWFVERHLEGYVSWCLYYEATTSESPSALISNRPQLLPVGASKQMPGEVEPSSPNSQL